MKIFVPAHKFHWNLFLTAVWSLEILVASDFDKAARTAIYYLQYYYM